MNMSVSTLVQQLGGVYRDPHRVTRDIEAVINSRSTGLTTTITTYIDNSGVQSNLLTLSGTIPIVYRTGDGARYNIPVEFFIPPAYPVRCPLCYVRPIQGMAIKERHRHCGMDGMIYIPYLHEWRPRSHSLTEMIVWMQSIFGQDPPVFAVARGITSAPAPAATVISQPGFASANNTVSSGNTQPSPPAYDAVLAQQREVDEQRKIDEEKRLTEELKIRTTNETRAELTKKLKSHVGQIYDNARNKGIEEMKRQKVLEQGQKEVKEQIHLLNETKDKLQGKLDELELQTVKLRGILPELESKGEVSVDELAVPADTCSRQLLDLSAQNAAYSDCLYHLQEACYNDVISNDEYMLTVRRLAREQFRTRYHLKKVASVLERQ